MVKRVIKPLTEFIVSASPQVYYVDCQFGRIGFASSELSGTITTRVNASGVTFIVEIDNEDNDSADMGLGEKS